MSFETTQYTMMDHETIQNFSNADENRSTLDSFPENLTHDQESPLNLVVRTVEDLTMVPVLPYDEPVQQPKKHSVAVAPKELTPARSQAMKEFLPTSADGSDQTEDGMEVDGQSSGVVSVPAATVPVEKATSLVGESSGEMQTPMDWVDAEGTKVDQAKIQCSYNPERVRSMLTKMEGHVHACFDLMQIVQDEGFNNPTMDVCRNLLNTISSFQYHFINPRDPMLFEQSDDSEKGPELMDANLSTEQ